MQRIAIIGAGLCGLRCAEVLQTGGIEVQLFDKSRGLGGRLATRRHQHWRFDHGCPSLHGEQGEWQQLIDRYSAWYTEGAVGTRRLPPLGINQLAKDLGASMHVYRDCLIESVEQTSDGWLLRDNHGTEFANYHRVVMTLPPPQAMTLLASLDTPLSSRLETVSMAPSWVMMCVAPSALIENPEHYPENSFIQRITAEHSKPGRTLPEHEYAYVVEATPQWSAQQEELDADTAADHLTQELQRLTPHSLQLTHRAAHRWRYAHTKQALGEPWLFDSELGLALAGDWCLGNGAESAYYSGTALAQILLQERG